MTTIKIITSTASTAPIIAPMEEEESLELGDGDSATTSQSPELNETSIAGQLESISMVVSPTDIDGEDLIQSSISVTTSSAGISTAVACTVTLVLNTMVFTKFPCAPRQLKVSLPILKIQEHLGVIACITCDLISSSFCHC